MAKRKHTKTPTAITKDNSVGNAINRNNRKKAKQSLKTAHELEAEQVSLGYRWVANGKLSKFVAPSRIEHYQYKGFRVINQ